MLPSSRTRLAVRDYPDAQHLSRRSLDGNRALRVGEQSDYRSGYLAARAEYPGSGVGPVVFVGDDSGNGVPEIYGHVLSVPPFGLRIRMLSDPSGVPGE